MEQYNLFVEQAEYIEDTESFLKWSTEHPEEEKIIQKLSQGGAKLIIGPRGCGKTTLMLKTFHKLCEKSSAAALPIYVNFKTSLKLEPFYKKKANAVFLFNQWLILKIYQGLYNTLETLKVEIEMQFPKRIVDEFTSRLEIGNISSELEEFQISIPDLEKDVLKALSKLGRNRCVLLLDDAAHAFSPEQQRDFFDFFRRIKSRIIAPKAAIYPGVTMYSSTFHIGHDAELIDVWIKPDTHGYIEFMTDLLEKRLPIAVYEELLKNESLLNLVFYASFGIPRSLLNMVRNFYEEYEDNKYKYTFQRRTVLRIIKESIANTMQIYTSLGVKVPIYENFIKEGELLFNKMISLIKEYNKNKGVENQSVTLALKSPIPQELSKVLGFFQYAGLILPKQDLSKGKKGVFELYVIHYAALIERNAFFSKKSINISEYAKAFEKRNNREITRISPNNLMGTEDFLKKFALSLPPCQTCKMPRTEHAKFCINCGSQLKIASVFDSLVITGIEKLPLTSRRVDTIKENSKIKTVKDILMDHDYRQLRSVPRIGPFWAKQIYAYAEEFIS